MTGVDGKMPDDEIGVLAEAEEEEEVLENDRTESRGPDGES